MRPTADYWIEKLGLTQHIEGGAFREVYRSPLIIPKGSLPAVFKGDKNISTSIYFLLAKGQFSAFHRIASDEGWHFYYGDTLLIFEITHDGTLITHRLGSDIENGERFQTTIRAGSWFASAPAEKSEYALVGCTVSPGFDFADFELAEKASLSSQFPQHAGLIQQLTRV